MSQPMTLDQLIAALTDVRTDETGPKQILTEGCDCFGEVHDVVLWDDQVMLTREAGPEFVEKERPALDPRLP